MNQRIALWIAGYASVLLIFAHVLATTYITSYSSADWGLLLRLPWTFWLGLSILGVLLYIGRKNEYQTAITSILIFVFLFVIPLLVLENKASWLSISYERASATDYILSQGYLSFEELNPWDLMNWPGFFFISAFLSSVTGLPTTWFADYFPLLVLALIGLVAYSLLRLRFDTISSSLGTVLVIASFYTGQEYFCPQAIAYVLFIAILLLVAKLFFSSSRSAGLSACIIVLFFAAVCTHLLTSFMILAAMAVVYAFRKLFLRKLNLSAFFSVGVCILFITVFFIYQTLVINQSFIEITSSLYTQIMGQDTHISNVVGISQSRVIGSTAYQLEIYGTYTITILAIALGLISTLIVLIGILRRKQEVALDSFWVAWIITAGILGLSISYGGEAIARAFMFMLLPTSFFAIKYFHKRPGILVLILVFLVFLHFPASYARQNYIYIPTSELKGVSAFSSYGPTNTLIFYEYLAPTPYSPTPLVHYINIQKLAGFYSLPSTQIVNQALNGVEYLFISSLENNQYTYFLGMNPLQNISFVDTCSRLYDNSEFQIYRNVTYG